MGALISGHFDKGRRRRCSLHSKLNSALLEFDSCRTLFAAQNLRATIFPDSELFGHYLAANGCWVAELRYDHLVHEAEGPTLAIAIVNAVRQIVDALESEEPAS